MTRTTDIETIRDLWEAELEREISDPAGTSQERLAAETRSEPIPNVRTPPENTWMWSDLHLDDPSMLVAWRRPFRSVYEMNHHLLQLDPARAPRRHHHLPGRRRPPRRLAEPTPPARRTELPG